MLHSLFVPHFCAAYYVLQACFANLGAVLHFFCKIPFVQIVIVLQWGSVVLFCIICYDEAKKNSLEKDTIFDAD